MDVNRAQRINTPMQHQKTILLVGTLNPTPKPMLIGAPTDIVPNKPSPMTPYLSQIFKTKPGSDLKGFGFLNLFSQFLMISPR